MLQKWIDLLNEEDHIHRFSTCHCEIDKEYVLTFDRLTPGLMEKYKMKDQSTPRIHVNKRCLFAPKTYTYITTRKFSLMEMYKKVEKFTHGTGQETSINM